MYDAQFYVKPNQRLPHCMKKMFFSQSISIVLFLFFTLMLIAPHASVLAFAILSLTGVVVIFRDQAPIYSNTDFKIYTALAWCFFLVIGITIINTDNIEMGIHKLGSNIHFIFAPFVMVLLYKLDMKTIVPSAIKLGVIVAGIYAVYQFHVIGMSRVNGIFNPVTFGGMITILSFLSIVNFPKDNLAEKILSLLAFAFGLYASYLSGTRGAWILVPILGTLVLFIWFRAKYLSIKNIVIVMLTSILGLALMATDNHIKKRINLAVIEFEQVMEKDSKSSVGTRITMWRHGLEVSKQSPYLGYGIQNTNSVVAKHIDPQNTSIYNHFNSFHHLHNQYVDTLVGQGVLGLSMLLLLLFTPLVIFVKRLQKGNTSQMYFLSIGIVTIVGYLGLGLTDRMFSHTILNIFFLMLVAIAFAGSSPLKR